MTEATTDNGAATEEPARRGRPRGSGNKPAEKRTRRNAAAEVAELQTRINVACAMLEEVYRADTGCQSGAVGIVLRTAMATLRGSSGEE